MNLIVAVDEDWGIGKDNQLLVHISEDLKYFKKMTTGHAVVMGRKTLESFPKKKPLPNRVNIVITRDASYEVEGAEVVHSIQEAKDKLAELGAEDAFVIGGDSIYKQMLDDCDRAYVTKISKCFEADAHFPNLDEKDEWQIVEKSPVQEQDDFTYQWVTYEKR